MNFPKLMIKANARYTGLGWNSLGPVLLTDVIRWLYSNFSETLLSVINCVRDLCHLGKGQNEPLLGHHPHCFNLTVLDHSYFYPIKHVDRLVLFQSNKNQFWQNLFSKALSVHFYGSNTSGRGGWLTGKSTAYDYLGKKFCPQIYSIQNNLDLWLR